MKALPWILMIILLIALPGCSGCNKPADQPMNTIAPVKQAPVAPPRAMMPPAPPAKLEAPPAPTTAEAKDAKEKIKKIMPKIAEAFSSPEFKEKLRQSAQSQDFKQFTQVMYGVLQDACKEQGLAFEDCMKMMNANKEDPEVKEMVMKLKESFDFSKK